MHASQDKLWKQHRPNTLKKELVGANKAATNVNVPEPELNSVFDVKFCPFLPDNAPPIFAFTQGQNVFVARLSADPEQTFTIVHAIEDLDEGRNTKTKGTSSYQVHCSLAWMRDTESGDPLLLFSGNVPKIHVYNVAKQNYVKSLTGHGSGIQDIVPHPTLPSIFATCSDDHEVRIWNLDSKFEDSWCAVICHGEFGHTGAICSIAFTKNGQYLMSGGRDTWMHLWAMPPPEELLQLPKEKVKSKRVYYPHFSSADVHPDIIDCIRFYGDLVVSRSVGYKIMIWMINGFSSSDPVPDPPTKREPGQLTSSAFGTGFMVLFSFNHMLKDSLPIYYHRFSIFAGPDGQTVLAMGDLGKPVIHFWNLSKLEQEKEKSEFSGDPVEAIEPHEILRPKWDKKVKESIGYFRAMDWSMDGKWLVAGYDYPALLICWK